MFSSILSNFSCLLLCKDVILTMHVLYTKTKIFTERIFNTDHFSNFIDISLNFHRFFVIRHLTLTVMNISLYCTSK